MSDTNGLRKTLLQLAPYAGLLVLVSAMTGFTGYVVGRAYGPIAQAPPAASAATCVPADGNSPEAIAKRNIVWRTLNGQGDTLQPSPERAIAAAIGLLLNSEADVQARNAGMQMLMRKSFPYFTREEVEAIQKAMGDATPADLADSVRRISAADGQAADLIRAVLADRDRIARYTSGNLPIPLETLPDGTTP